MTLKQQALFYVVRGVAAMILSAVAVSLTLTYLGITKTIIAALIVLIGYGLYMLYQMELSRLERLAELNELSK